jgi:predicted ATPase/DNA-binding CsgD family transcriptional regulator
MRNAMTIALPGIRLAGFPIPPTPFVGREGEIATVGALLRRADVRLLTLAGTGGVGKTRLALRVAEAGASDHADGAAFVSLAAVREASLVAAAVADALGLDAAGEEPLADQLADAVRERDLLLVLDNFEHVVAAAPLLAGLLSNCPRLKLLVTSRSVLRLSGERVFTVPPLGLPEAIDEMARPPTLADVASVEAVRLFVDRAQAARGDFALTEANAPAVAEVCTRLDGLPLAIELAAARVAVLPPAALLARMERRLPLLTSGARDAPTRQQTMRAAIAWSHDPLTAAEQALFRRLSVFAGGFALDAAEAVVGGRDDSFLLSPCPPARLSISVLDGIAALIEHSLIRRAPGVVGEARYAMLETIREFGAEQLAASGEAAAISDAHAAWFVALAERAEPGLIGPEQGAWVERLQVDLGNLRAALVWLRERGDVGAALRLAGAIGWYWSSPGHFHEGRDLFDALLAMPGTDDHPAALAKALASAGDIADWLGDAARAEAFYERAMGLYRAFGDDRRLASMSRGLGSIALDLGDFARANVLLEDALALARACGEDWEAAAAANLLGGVAFALGDAETAIERHEEALAGWLALDDPGHVVTALASLGTSALGGGRSDRARTAYRQVLEMATDLDDRWHLVRAVAGFGGLAAMRGESEGAARLLGAAAAQTETIGAPLRPAAQALFDRLAAAARASLGEAAFAAAWEAGRALTLDEAVAEARAEAAQTGDPPSPPAGVASTAGHGLTGREVEVLRLVATGLTDREIAERLCIARRTASKHVAAILAKLEVRTRRAAVSAATRLGLL